MSDLREQIENILDAELSELPSIHATNEIIALVRADYEQKVIEAVERAFQNVPWGWDGDCDAERIIIEAIKQVMADE